MSTSFLFHTQSIVGFLYEKVKSWGKEIVILIRQNSKKQKCVNCESSNVTAVFLKNRRIRGLPIGRKPVFFDVKIHRLKCHDCGLYRQEALPFLSGKKRHYTRALERFIVELRPHLSILSISKLYHLDWDTIKSIEKRNLQKRYAKIPLKDLEYIGIDEIHVGQWKYFTIVIDLVSGAVIYIGEGKSKASLQSFSRRLKRSSCKIKAVAMDMSDAYISWAKEVLPEAEIVFDHFHVIKLMNEKIDQVRRSEYNKARKLVKAEETQKQLTGKSNEADRLGIVPESEVPEEAKIQPKLELKPNQDQLINHSIAEGGKNVGDQKSSPTPQEMLEVLKGIRWLLLKGKEKIESDEEAKARLQILTELNKNLALTYQLKELLRSIYTTAKNVYEAEKELEKWCTMARQSGIQQLDAMANTIKNHWDGILAYWKLGITSAKVEGFNNKIRWLIKQAYGYRDKAYFKLKIFDLPSTSIEKSL